MCVGGVGVWVGVGVGVCIRSLGSHRVPQEPQVHRRRRARSVAFPRPAPPPLTDPLIPTPSPGGRPTPAARRSLPLRPCAPPLSLPHALRPDRVTWLSLRPHVRLTFCLFPPNNGPLARYFAPQQESNTVGPEQQSQYYDEMRAEDGIEHLESFRTFSVEPMPLCQHMVEQRQVKGSERNNFVR